MFTCAKINLFLKVTGLRKDGYHELETLYWPVLALCDSVTVTLRDSGPVCIACDSPDVPVDASNICHKAASLFMRATGLELSPHISICKRIPVAAGLGGGSSDAAATLLQLRRLSAPGMPDDALHAIAARVGADVPFFLKPVPAVATGIGDIISPLQSVGTPSILIVSPVFPVTAAWTYSHWNRHHFEDTRTLEDIIRAVTSGDWAAVASLARNDLEHCVFAKFPLLQILRKRLKAAGALSVHVSGSGPSLFAFLDNPQEAAQSLLNDFKPLIKCFPIQAD